MYESYNERGLRVKKERIKSLKIVLNFLDEINAVFIHVRRKNWEIRRFSVLKSPSYLK